MFIFNTSIFMMFVSLVNLLSGGLTAHSVAAVAVSLALAAMAFGLNAIPTWVSKFFSH